ncbi:hypothetical protein [Pseudodonghicola sp.]
MNLSSGHNVARERGILFRKIQEEIAALQREALRQTGEQMTGAAAKPG